MPLDTGLQRSSSTQRSSLDASVYPTVDTSLKSLKLLARRFSAILSAFEDESRILERIFYKGKNQHRAALFWRRVQDLRRLCNRLIRLDLEQVMNQIRHAFYDSTDYQNQAILKSSWTHLPDAKAFELTIQNLAPVHTLLDVVSHSFVSQSKTIMMQMERRLAGAYCLLQSAMQSGAFLQLIVTLSAIVSRLQFLTRELLGKYADLISILHNLCSSTTELPALPASDKISDSVHLNTSNKNTLANNDDPSMSIINKARAVVEHREVPENPRQDATAREPKAKPKKKKPRDEIDAIFGF